MAVVDCGLGDTGFLFGVHKPLDKAGAVVGPLVAYGVLSWLGETAAGYHTLFLTAFVPAVLSIVVLATKPKAPSAPANQPIWNGHCKPAHVAPSIAL